MRASRVLAVVGLSALIGSGWLLTQAYPSELASPFAGCLHFAVIGLVGLLALRIDARRNPGTGLSRGHAAYIAASGLGIFVLPGVVGQLVAGAVSASAIAALFCAVPLMIVLGTAWFCEGRTSLMIPSLVGLFGALLIFTVEVPGSVRRALCLAAVFGCCVTTAAASVFMFRLMQGLRTAAALTVTGFAGSMVLGVYGFGVGWPRMTLTAVGFESVRCIVFDLPVVWVTLWLMREVPPARLAARFLIAPLVTWLEGYAFVRGPVELRSGIALVLMAAGAGMLLMKDEGEGITGLQLR